MKHTIYSLTIALATALFTSCGPSDADKAKTAAFQKQQDSIEAAKKALNDAPPVEFTWEQLEKTDPKELSDLSIKGVKKRIIFEGYLAIPSSIYTSGNSIRCHLFPRPGQSNGFYTNLEFTQGKGNNNMEKMPEKYSDADFKVHTANGEVVGQGSYVKITGNLSGRYDEYATVYIEKVEKAEPKPFDYAAAATQLTDANMDEMDNKLVAVDGVLSVPMFVYITDDMPLNIDNSDLKNKFGVNVLVGDGPNQISNLPEGWKASDIKIHDNAGNVVRKGAKTRVYGVWNKSSIGDQKGSIHVESISAK
jgi:hypothetical protein